MATMTLRGRRGGRMAVTAWMTAMALMAVSACTQESTGEAGPTTTGGGESISGELEIIVSSAAASDAAFQQINADFMAEYPDVEVVFSTVSNDNYPATRSSRLTAGNVDIFSSSDMRTVPDYAADSTPEEVLLARAGGLVDLSGQPFLDNYTPTVVEAQSVDGAVFSVPTGLSYSTGVYYNATLFDSLGLEVPTTWSQLQSVVADLEADGSAAFGIGGRDGWPAGLPMLGAVGSLFPTDDDKHALAAGLWANEIALDERDQMQVLEQTQWLFEHTQANFAGAGYDDIPAQFASQAVAMVPDGTWNSPTILDAVDGQFEVGYFPFPGSEDAADNAYLNGKIELMLSVPESAPNKEAALAWLEFFSQPATYAAFVEMSGFSPAQPDIAASEFLDSIAQYTVEFRSAWDTIWVANVDAGQDAVYPFNYPALAPMGTSTPAEAARAAQNAWATAF